MSQDVIGTAGAVRQVLTDQAISRSEREDLQRLIRQREKVLKSAAKQRSA
jgi:hypothetical protein